MRTNHWGRNAAVMQETLPKSEEVHTNAPATNAYVAPSCMRAGIDGEPAVAYPPIRMVEVAKAFGPNAVVQSICQDDFGPAIDVILRPMVYQLQNVTQDVEASVPATDCADPQNWPLEWRQQ